MLKVRIIPCLLYRNHGLVKGLRFKNFRYVGDPTNAIRIFNEKEVDELIFLDIEATLKKQPPHYALIENIANECFMPLCYGGGIRDLEIARKIFSLGVEKICLNTAALEVNGLLESLTKTFGSQSIVVSVDIKKNIWGRYSIYTRCGTKKWALSPRDYIQSLQEKGVGEILINDISRDGTQLGFDEPMICELMNGLNIPVIVAGGAGSLQDIQKVINTCKVSAVAAGSLFVFHGKHQAVLINYPSPKEIDSLM